MDVGAGGGLGADSYQLHDLEQITELLSLSFSLCKKVECYLLCSCQDSKTGCTESSQGMTAIVTPGYVLNGPS